MRTHPSSAVPLLSALPSPPSPRPPSSCPALFRCSHTHSAPCHPRPPLPRPPPRQASLCLPQRTLHPSSLDTPTFEVRHCAWVSFAFPGHLVLARHPAPFSRGGLHPVFHVGAGAGTMPTCCSVFRFCFFLTSSSTPVIRRFPSSLGRDGSLSVANRVSSRSSPPTPPQPQPHHHRWRTALLHAPPDVGSTNFIRRPPPKRAQSVGPGIFELGFRSPATYGSHIAHDGHTDLCGCNGCSLDPITPP